MSALAEEPAVCGELAVLFWCCDCLIGRLVWSFSGSSYMRLLGAPPIPRAALRRHHTTASWADL